MSLLNVSEASFQKDVIEASFVKPVVVDLWATWCGPCRMVAPILEQLNGETDKLDIVKVDVDENPSIAAEYNVVSIPTMKVFVNGEVAATLVGAMPMPKLKVELAEFL